MFQWHKGEEDINKKLNRLNKMLVCNRPMSIMNIKYGVLLGVEPPVGEIPTVWKQ